MPELNNFNKLAYLIEEEELKVSCQKNDSCTIYKILTKDGEYLTEFNSTDLLNKGDMTIKVEIEKIYKNTKRKIELSEIDDLGKLILYLNRKAGVVWQ